MAEELLLWRLIEERFNKIDGELTKLALIDDLNTAVQQLTTQDAALKAAVVAALTDLTAEIAALQQAAVSSNSSLTADIAAVQGTVNDLTAATADLVTADPGPQPTPAPTPAP